MAESAASLSASRTLGASLLAAQQQHHTQAVDLATLGTIHLPSFPLSEYTILFLFQASGFTRLRVLG